MMKLAVMLLAASIAVTMAHPAFLEPEESVVTEETSDVTEAPMLETTISEDDDITTDSVEIVVYSYENGSESIEEDSVYSLLPKLAEAMNRKDEVYFTSMDNIRQNFAMVETSPADIEVPTEAP
ncbi:uncharacterized protein LOC135162688 [Diachasmimorpha longicaudata]|uniref:uncharacterized protein LOC135162688 n=1 Tax=Diachasmimorpha longicaudata TaxID=58733 RepID=UPI0030B91B5D